jgi:hypothetical protein
MSRNSWVAEASARVASSVLEVSKSAANLRRNADLRIGVDYAPAGVSFSAHFLCEASSRGCCR